MGLCTKDKKFFKKCYDLCPNRIENLYQLFLITNDLKYYTKAFQILINYNEENYVHYNYVEHDLYKLKFIIPNVIFIFTF